MNLDPTLPFQTLHCHTTTSDGLLSYEEVLDQCKANKIGVVAFTDHDSLADPEKLNDLRKSAHPVKFISGIEISCDTLPEVDGKLPLFHVTGLFVDPENNGILDLSRKQLADRIIRMRKFVKNLNDLGFTISEEDVLRHAGGKAVGMPHMVAALSEQSQNWDLLNRFYEELKIEAKTDPLRKKQLQEVESREEKQKWYVLVMSENALHSVYVNYADEPLVMDKAVELIRGAGGIALIAHWSYLRDRLTIEIIETLLKTDRIDGMETVYSFGIEKNRDLFVSDMLKLSELCNKYNKVQGGGGDFHKIEDFALMTNPNFSDFAQRTEGLLTKILTKHPNLNRNWSSLDQK